MTDLEEHLAHLYNTTAIPPDLPVEDIVSGAVRKGRRRRRRRMAGVAAEWTCAAVLLIALVGAPVALFWPRGYPSGSAVQGAPLPSQTTSARAIQPLAPHAVVQTLTALLLPHGQVTNSRATTSSTGDSVGTVDLNVGQGPFAVSAVISTGPPAVAGTGQFACPSTATGVTCAVRTLSDGSVLLRSQETPAAGSAAQWTVRLGRADGVSIGIYEWNTTAVKGSTARGDSPPLPMTELQAIAESPQW